MKNKVARIPVNHVRRVGEFGESTQRARPAIAFSADSTRFASGGEGAKIVIRAVKTGSPLDIPIKALLGLADDQSAQGAVVSSIAFSPDGASLAVAVNDQVAVASAAVRTTRIVRTVFVLTIVTAPVYIPVGLLVYSLAS